MALGNFPANPSTWYTWTYIHFLLIWAAVLRRVPIGPGAVALAAAAEVALRAALWRVAEPFVAYMAFPNWAAVFLLGLACGRCEEPGPRGRSTLIAPALGTAADRAATSAAITLAYLLITALAYEITRRLPPPAAVLRFFICFVLLAAFSELVRSVVRPTHWRDEIWRHAIQRAAHPQARTSSPA